MIFNIDKETLPREDIEALQLRRLRDLCSRVYANVPFYRKRFDESGIKPGDIKSLADLKNLPFTEKQDLRNYYPFGLFQCKKAVTNFIKIPFYHSCHLYQSTFF